MSVTELRNDTVGVEHNAIRELVLSVRIMGANMVTASNIRNVILGHPSFAQRRVDVFIVKQNATTAALGPLTGDLDISTNFLRFNIQRVEGVGDVIVVMPR